MQVSHRLEFLSHQVLDGGLLVILCEKRYLLWPEISLLLHLENVFFFPNSISFSLPREDDGYQPHLLMNWYKLKEHIITLYEWEATFPIFICSPSVFFLAWFCPLLFSRVFADSFWLVTDTQMKWNLSIWAKVDPKVDLYIVH